MTRNASRTLAVALLALTGCAGPRAPLDVGIKEYPTDVILGAQQTPAPPSAIVAFLDSGIPIPVQAPPPRTAARATPAPTPVEPCPAADPLSAPRYEAMNKATKPPAGSSYAYRASGSMKVGGTPIAVPPQITRAITNVKAASTQADASYTFDIAEGGTTTSYRVDPTGSTPGIYITKIVTKRAGQADDVFTPQPPLTLARFPLEAGKTWESVSFDPGTQTTMSFQGRVGIDVPNPEDKNTTVLLHKDRVDACGTYLDAYLINLRGNQGQGPGRIVSPTKNLTFTAVYAIAPQFGGFSVRDTVQTQGTISGVAIDSTLTTNINSEPKVP